MIPFVGFIGGTYEHPRSVVSAERCINWIPERVPPQAGSKGSWVYLARPGLSAVVTAGVGPYRGGFEQNDRFVVVSGPALYELTWSGSAWSATLRGTSMQLGNDGRMASLAGNGPQGGQIAIASNGNGFLFDLVANTLTQITDLQFPANVVKVVFLRGHFVWIVEDGTTFHLSDAYDGASYVTTDVGERQMAPDYLRSVLVDDESSELFLFGRQKTEVWWYNGALGFPAEPVNVLIPIGMASTFGVTTLGSSIYGVGQSREGRRNVIRFQSGYQPDRVSHHAIDAAFRTYSETQIAGAVAFSLEWAGHLFVVVTFDGVTWVYDETTDLWHQWDYWDAERGESQAFLGLGHHFVFGQNLMGSRRDGTIYQFTEDALDDDGAVIRCVRRSPYVHANNKRVTHNAIAFDVQRGVGNEDAPDPIGMLRWSDTQGRTWSTEHVVSLGAQGDYEHDAVVRRLGLQGRKGRIYELVITDPVVRALAGAYLDVGAAE